VLHVVDLNAGYGKLAVLFGVNVDVPDRQITVLIGPNGSGKSTLLKAIFGLATINSGRILLDDQDITHVSPHQKARTGMAYLPQVENVFANLTVEENLKIAGYALDRTAYQDGLELALSAFPELKALMSRRTGTLSGGERQYLAIATALVRKARFLLLDEPTAQLAPKLAEAMFERITSLKENLRLTLVLVEQDVRRALAVGDSAYALVSGKVAFQGKARELLEHEEFEKLCMGIC
jgi:branched-chain amino acid transport system ATP-binding protein